MKLLSVSILIPTLNAARVLGRCLASIAEQDYPQNKLEIIIADGGSTDETRKIAKKYQAKIHENRLKTAEAGKAIALRYAQNQLVLLLDSDNALPEENWLRKMVAPFADPEILGSEPWEFTYQKNDSLVNRYCALLGANDPYCYFVGNYDKQSWLSGRWTELKVKSSRQKWSKFRPYLSGQAKLKMKNGKIEKAKGEDWDYLKVKIELPNIPTIGANGTIWRAEVLKKAVGKSDYLFDTDVPYLLAGKNPFWFAKVKVGIIHDYCRTINDFYRKQKRRAKDFFYLEGQKERKETYQRQFKRQLYFILSVITIFPLVIQAARGYLRKPDRAWFFHPFACLLTLWLYGTETIWAKFKKSQMDRSRWRQ